jgi:hypothetical protein
MSGEKNRHFGNIRKLASGRYQARYRGPDGRLHAAPHTFERKSEASRWLSFKDTEITQGEWIAPELAKKKFHEYAGEWMRDRVLKVRTEELYRGLLRNHLLPTFGDMSMGDIDEGAVRRWFARDGALVDRADGQGQVPWTPPPGPVPNPSNHNKRDQLQYRADAGKPPG